MADPAAKESLLEVMQATVSASKAGTTPEQASDDFYDEDDEMMVMTIVNADDCIGCVACAKVCPKNCHTHEAAAA